MKKFKKYRIYLIGFVAFLISTVVSANFNLFELGKQRVLYSDTDETPATESSTESIVSYAMKWDQNPNILYVYGGDRVHTLEELDAGKIGTDCSGFVTRVWSHFGYEFPAQSSALYKAAKQVFTDQSLARPGDICWWNGHVGLYIGENRMIHTNTKNPPNNKIHVNTLGVDYKVPSAYLRMVDDSVLDEVNKGGNGTSEEEDKDTVLSAKSGGSLATESDLTGMVMEESLLWDQSNLSLRTAADLPTEDRDNVAYIKDSMEDTKPTFGTWFGRVNAFIGLVLLLYSILLIVGYLLDYVNVFVDISLVGILSLGKLRVVSESDVEDGTVQLGKQTSSKVAYLTAKGLVIRCVVLMFIGFFFVSGVISSTVYKLLSGVGVFG